MKPILTVQGLKFKTKQNINIHSIHSGGRQKSTGVRLFGGLRESGFVAAVVMISGLPDGSHHISLVYLDIKCWNFYSAVIRREPV